MSTSNSSSSSNSNNDDDDHSDDQPHLHIAFETQQQAAAVFGHIGQDRCGVDDGDGDAGSEQSTVIY